MVVLGSMLLCISGAVYGLLDKWEIPYGAVRCGCSEIVNATSAYTVRFGAFMYPTYGAGFS